MRVLEAIAFKPMDQDQKPKEARQDADAPSKAKPAGQARFSAKNEKSVSATLRSQKRTQAHALAFPFRYGSGTRPTIGDLMIYKRVAARLRAQDWVAITIEPAIVVGGGNR